MANRSRVRKHTVFINGKEKVAFLEKIAQNKLSEIKEPELIFIFNGKRNQQDLLNAWLFVTFNSMICHQPQLPKK